MRYFLQRPIMPPLRLLSLLAGATIVVSGASEPVAPQQAIGRPDTRKDVESQLAMMDDLDIDTGPLSHQLTLLLSRRNITYVYSFEDLQGVSGAAVHGRLSVAEALQRLLDSAGCSKHFFAGSIAIVCARRREAVARAR